MTLSTFNQDELAALQAEAEKKWGDTAAFQAFSQQKSSDSFANANEKMMAVLNGFSSLLDLPVQDTAVQNQVIKLQELISQEFYPCTDQVLAGLGQMYATDERFAETIDQHAGKGVSLFVSQAIAAYVEK